MEHVLANLPAQADKEKRIIHGLCGNEDAVVLRSVPSDMALVQTVDLLSPIGNNARLFGQVAAANALSDVYAMGGEPWCVMNIAAFPAAELPVEILTEILQGGMEKIIEAEAVLAGGHTLEDPLIKYGLAVTGMVSPTRIAKNSGLSVGDNLILTKPLGTGVLATAIKADWFDAEQHEQILYHWATRLNRYGGQVIREMALHAATDITGFGLGGHATEMAIASDVCVELFVSELPFMPQVLDLADNGLIPAGTYANRSHCLCKTHCCQDVDELRSLLVFDAQTSGGLLLAVPQERTAEAVARLQELGEAAWVIGRVLPSRRDVALLLS